MNEERKHMLTPGGEVIDAYRDLERTASRMLALAREGDWDAMIGEGEQYVTAAAALAKLEEDCDLNEREHRAKHDILERTLGYDLEIRGHLLEHREELGRLMAVSRRERAVAGAYGAVGPVAVDVSGAGKRPP